MGLFGKKKPAEFCAICGKERKTGLLRGLFQTEIEGQYVCSDCYGSADIQSSILTNITMDQFKAYVAFREENQKLKERFHTTNTIELGVWGSKILFDLQGGLMSFDENLNKTIFQRGCLRSFVIREDDRAIFDGTAEGMNCFESDVQEQIRMMGPAFVAFSRECRMYEDRLRFMNPEQREEEERTPPLFCQDEPFRKFHVELYFDHPYWNEMTLSMDGPRFDSREPNAAQYMAEYRDGYNTMRELANALMSFGFPNALKAGAAASAAAQGNQTDAVEALKKFKELLDMGVITEEEFAAKKRQLLGL